MVSETASTSRFKANRAMTDSGNTHERCKICKRFHSGECWDLQTCGKCGETGHPDHRHDYVMRQRAERDKSKKHSERKARKATAQKAAKTAPSDSEDSSSDTDVGSELAALSASFADAVTRVGKRASAKTMKGLRANATPVGQTANEQATEGLEWVKDPGIWIFMGSGICTAGIISQFEDVRITPAKVICIELSAQARKVADYANPKTDTFPGIDFEFHDVTKIPEGWLLAHTTEHVALDGQHLRMPQINLQT